MTNDDLAKIVDTNDAWIRARTGIRERRVVAADQAASDLATVAAREALDAAGVGAEEIDLILVGSASPDHIFPATACLVQNRLGAANAGAVDISAACSSFVYALSVAHAHVVAGLARRVLVIG
ncbi:MAG: 3-oxoacyl-ACP synthase, partial [Armatimonadetes bacterium]|nr:3-oxoacyl-ACP synthase [Armatimonadota bacterium]